NLRTEQGQTQKAWDTERKRRRQTRAALDAMTHLWVEDLLARQPVLTDQHKEFLRAVLNAYQEFAADTGQDEEARAGVAGAHRRVGAIRDRLGQSKAAEAAFVRSRDLHARLAAEFPDNRDHRAGWAHALFGLGTVHMALGRPAAAEAVYRQGGAVYEKLAA